VDVTEPNNQIILGTAQFGLDYGIVNSRGKIAESGAQEILDRAWDSGIRALDTARLYGDSEAVLGKALAPEKPFNIVTKTPVINKALVTVEDAADFRGALESSLNLLGLGSVYGLMVHHARNLLLPGGQHLIGMLEKAKAEMLVDKIGISAYSGEEIDAILKIFIPDIIQLPFNIADQRLAASGHLAKLKGLGVEIHARSIFLQGVLLQDPDDLPEYFAPVRYDLKEFGIAANAQGLSRLEACFAFALAQSELDRLVVGVTCLSDLDEFLEALDLVGSKTIERPPFAAMKPQFTDPSQWPQQI